MLLYWGRTQRWECFPPKEWDWGRTFSKGLKSYVLIRWKRTCTSNSELLEWSLVFWNTCLESWVKPEVPFNFKKHLVKFTKDTGISGYQKKTDCAWTYGLTYIWRRLIPVCTVLWFLGGTFGRWLGHEGRVLVNGVGVLMKETAENFLAPPVCGAVARRHAPVNQGAGSHQALSLLAPSSWSFQPAKLWEVSFVYKLPSLWYFTITAHMDSDKSPRCSYLRSTSAGPWCTRIVFSASLVALLLSSFASMVCPCSRPLSGNR